jgi:hypothetical protein
MWNKCGSIVAASLVLVSPLTEAADTQLAVAISLPQAATAAFKALLQDPANFEAMRNCEETADAAENQTLSPDFPRQLGDAQDPSFDRLLFVCSNANPSVYGAFGAASIEASRAAKVPVASIRMVVDTFEPISLKALGAGRCAWMYCPGGTDWRYVRPGTCSC